MTISKEAMAKLIEATIQDSVDHRYEILERAGDEDLFNDVNDLPETVWPFVDRNGEQVISVITGNDQLFEIVINDYGVQERPSDYINFKHGHHHDQEKTIAPKRPRKSFCRR